MKNFKFTSVFTMLLIAAALNMPSYSQSTSMGIEGGLNMANMSVTPTFNTTSRTGLMVGGFADIGVSRIVSIRPGVRYVMKGFSAQSNGVTYTEKLSYLEIPMFIKAGVPLKHVKPYALVGPTIGINLSASEDISVNNQLVQTNEAGASYETIDFGLYFGGGMEFDVAPGIDLFTGFGYSLGLTNVSKMSFEAKNSGLQFTGGVKFSL